MLLVLVYVYVVVPPSAFKYKMWQEFCERFVHLVSCVFLVLYLDAWLFELFVMMKLLMCYFDFLSLSLSLFHITFDFISVSLKSFSVG